MLSNISCHEFPVPLLNCPSRSRGNMILSIVKHGHDFFFVFFYCFSNMAILAPWKKSITAEATTRIFFYHFWVDFVLPWIIISNRDIKFLSTFWSNLWSLVDTKLTKSTTFHPQTNGKMEVVNMMIVHIMLISTPSIHIHGMKPFHMFNVTITYPSMALLATMIFRCAWGSSH
jgi:hypothetical protein